MKITHPLTAVNRLESTPISHDTSLMGYTSTNSSKLSLDKVQGQLWLKRISSNIHALWESNTVGFGNSMFTSLWFLLTSVGQQTEHIYSSSHLSSGNFLRQPLVAKISPNIHTTWKGNTVGLCDSLSSIFPSFWSILSLGCKRMKHMAKRLLHTKKNRDTSIFENCSSDPKLEKDKRTSFKALGNPCNISNLHNRR